MTLLRTSVTLWLFILRLTGAVWAVVRLLRLVLRLSKLVRLCRLSGITLALALLVLLGLCKCHLAVRPGRSRCRFRLPGSIGR